MHIELYTVPETAKILQMDRTTIYKEIKAGRLFPVRMRSNIRFTPQEIQRYVDACQTGPKTPRKQVQRKLAPPQPDKASAHDRIAAMGEAFKAKQRAARERR